MGTITSGVNLARDETPEQSEEAVDEASTGLAEAVDLQRGVPQLIRRVELDRRHLARNRVLTLDSPNPAKTAYKMLRTRLLRRMQANQWQTLAVTSVGQSEGKTLTALNLSISIAGQPEHSVILLDLDLRRPSIYRYLGLEAYPGISAWLEGRSNLHEILVNPGIEGFYVLPNDVSFDDSSERLQSQRMLDLVDQLKGLYPTSLLVFDMPPLMEADDALAFAPYVDAFLLVVSQGQTDRSRLAKAKELLEDSQVLGAVFNKSDEASSSYY